MPDHAPQTKIDAVRACGAEPVLVPIDDVFRYMKEHGWEQESYAFVHAWTERNVPLGHGTMGLEILEQCPDVETVFIPVGGGGLLGGVGSAFPNVDSPAHVGPLRFPWPRGADTRLARVRDGFFIIISFFLSVSNRSPGLVIT